MTSKYEDLNILAATDRIFLKILNVRSWDQSIVIKGFNKDPHHVSTSGERFVMDFGFVRGKYKIKKEDGPLITSKDGFNSYLLIMDVHTRYMWVFPTIGKSPPIAIVDSFLDRYGNKDGNRYVRTDNGGNLPKGTYSNDSFASIIIFWRPQVPTPLFKTALSSADIAPLPT